MSPHAAPSGPERTEAGFLRRVFDREKAFAESVARDLFRTSVSGLGSILTHYLTAAFKIIGFPDMVVRIIDLIDYVWLIGTLAMGAYIFLGKLWNERTR